jgi:Uma2 family endonuclease
MSQQHPTLDLPVSTMVEALRHSPKLPEIIARLQEILHEEEEAREYFNTNLPANVKAEFIEGQIVVQHALPLVHLKVCDHLHFVLRQHLRGSKVGGEILGQIACCRFPRNTYEPDIIYFGPEKVKDFEPDMVLLPVPDFVVEILSSETVGTDRGVKFHDYRLNGVAEYWIVDPHELILEQYLLSPKGEYVLRTKSSSGFVQSPVLGLPPMEVKELLRDGEM